MVRPGGVSLVLPSSAHLASGICRFLSFANLGKFSATVSLLPALQDSGDMNVSSLTVQVKPSSLAPSSVQLQ